jgi:hypothetical protein
MATFRALLPQSAQDVADGMEARLVVLDHAAR